MMLWYFMGAVEVEHSVISTVYIFRLNFSLFTWRFVPPYRILLSFVSPRLGILEPPLTGTLVYRTVNRNWVQKNLQIPSIFVQESSQKNAR